MPRNVPLMQFLQKDRYLKKMKSLVENSKNKSFIQKHAWISSNRKVKYDFTDIRAEN